MAYFANSSEGERFEEQWCATCAHYVDDAVDDAPTCPVLELHVAWNYEQENDDEKKDVLSNFIHGDDMFGWHCRMYHEDPEKAREAERRRVEQHPWVAARKGNGDG